MSTPGEESRRGRRYHRAAEHRIVAARIRPGYDVMVVDISAGGALVEGTCRLLPGTRVQLHLRRDRQAEMMRGRVLRCSVVHLRANVVCYRGAIAFDRPLPWFADEQSCGYSLPSGETLSVFRSWAETTRDVV
jgi:hypothetical protein